MGTIRTAFEIARLLFNPNKKSGMHSFEMVFRRAFTFSPNSHERLWMLLVSEPPIDDISPETLRLLSRNVQDLETMPADAIRKIFCLLSFPKFIPFQTTQCLARLTGLNANSTDLSNMNGGGGGNSPVGGRLLQQLLGGLGQNLDNLLKGLLGSGAQPGGGLLGQILSGGNTG